MFNYIINLSKSQKYLTLVTALFFGYTFTLFFPIRNVFITPEATLTGTYSDFTSFSLYLSDILLLLIIIAVWLPRLAFALNKPIIRKFNLNPERYLLPPFTWLIFLILISFFYNFTLFKRLNLIFLINTLKLIVAYGTLRVMFAKHEIKSIFIRLFTCFSGLQSIIALAQFWKQNSLGLYILGETHLNPLILGVAKIVSGGTTYIRGAGTFLHPNPLSAFLALGVFFSIYMLFTSNTPKNKVFYSFLTFLNILGVTATFSRGAYLALAFGLTLFFTLVITCLRGILIHRKEDAPQAKQNAKGHLLHKVGFSLAIVAMSIVTSFFLFKPFLMTRATFSDQATMDRRDYNSGGITMIKENPVFGVGMGKSLLHMEHALDKNLKPWDKQPPHNYFIIAGAELGLPVVFILIYIFLKHLWGLIIKLRSTSDFSHISYLISLISIFAIILLLMQFDHYFYTLEQTKLVLWTFLALVSSETKNT